MYEASGLLRQAGDLAASCSSPGRLVLLRRRRGAPRTRSPGLTVQSVQPLDEAVATAAAGLKILPARPRAERQPEQLIEREQSSRGRVNLVLDIDRASEVEISAARRLGDQRGDPAAIKAIPGIVDVQDVLRDPRRRSGARKCPVDGGR